jgi:hypothetical protein
VKPKRLWSNNGRKRFLTPFSFSVELRDVNESCTLVRVRFRFVGQMDLASGKRGQEPFPVHPAGQAGKETL